jgi:hypothetical protein
MEPETGYPIETSSNPDDKPGLTDPSEDPWTPAEEDESPTVTITIDDEDTYIEFIKITDTENVESVTVVVIDEDGNEVSSTTVTPTDDGNVFENIVDEDGSKIVVTFVPTDPSTPISVGPIEVTACAELGSIHFLTYCHLQLICIRLERMSITNSCSTPDSSLINAKTAKP